MRESKKRVRCAIYTRKSTEYGLEQEFNSLDAQRESAAAYIKSQTHEGWVLVPGRYDDGGLSGGSLDRPALQALLTAVRERQIDVIVVYKVDRLTRSLADFAKLVELFDAHNVSFVSVTQQFNTTNSMGRLTLNVLLSFAQFEREVTAERIRDKIAATKQKGIWIGGPVPLGYAVRDKKLIIVEDEAEQVRFIYRRYLELSSVQLLQRDLQARGTVSKRRTLSSGRVVGGTPYYVAGLSWLLKNRMYIGELNHKGKSYPAEHPPILEQQLFDAVQDLLMRNAVEFKRQRLGSTSLLIGKIFDDAGNRMSPVNTQKGPARYRYYVSVPLRRGKTRPSGSVSRVPAHDVEVAVAQALRATIRQEPDQSEALDDVALIVKCLQRVTVSNSALELAIRSNDDGSSASTVRVPFSNPNTKPVRRRISAADAADDMAHMRPSKRRRLLLGIAKARAWYEDLATGRVGSVREIALREKTTHRHVRQMLPLAFLPPSFIAAAIDNRLDSGAGLSKFVKELPLFWPSPNKSLT